jgi:peptidoglycan/LPS O-acetylase OafA/YrhL
MTATMPYRADIDGLRAVAILPVVLYHAGIPGFGGGFVGVDVFFVISGFLMASLISREIARGEFSLPDFYERRIRRIFPALFATMAASTAAAWLLLMPVEFEYFARSLKAAALFTSNVQFEKESGYFDIGAQMKPLLHTWSLAVEEQFYILFPLLMMLVGRHAARRRIQIFAALLLVSLAASAWMLVRSETAAFYLLQFRAWELLLGALVALTPLPTSVSARAREGLAALGIGLIALAVFGFDDHTPFPGLAALVPCLGAALVIRFGAGGRGAGSILRARPLVFVGLISYSLYLWHWPLIVFTRNAAGHAPTPSQSALLILASLVVAWLSWRYIERPFRGTASRIGRRPILVSAVAVMTAAIGMAGYVIRSEGIPERLPPAAQKVYAATRDESRFGAPPCFADSDNPGPSRSDIRSGRLCPLGAETGGAPAFLVWGDSHSGAMASAIDGAARQAGVSGLFAGHSSCPPLPGVQLSTRGYTQRCADFNAAVRDLVLSHHIQQVILIAYWPKYVHNAELPNQGVDFDPSVPAPLEDKSRSVVESFDRLLAELKQAGIKAVLVMDVPEMGHYMPEEVAKAIIKGTSTDLAPPWDYISKRQALSRAVLARMAKTYGASIVDPLPALCPNNHCETLRDGMPIFRDADHITATTSRSLSYLFTPVFSPAANGG